MNAKEREEFIVMKNEITHIKVDVNDIKAMLKKHIDWEADKYDNLDEKYLHREEANRRFAQIEEKNNSQDKQYNKITDWIFKIAMTLGMAGLGSKAIGIW